MTNEWATAASHFQILVAQRAPAFLPCGAKTIHKKDRKYHAAAG
jgi:hypothetical protein